MKLGVFFTFDNSLEKWDKQGLFSREVLYYEKLLKKKIITKIYFFTYGSKDLNFQNKLPENLKVVPMPKIFNFKIGKFIYSLLISWIKRKEIKNLDILKTNQMNGAWAAILPKKIYKKKLIVRCGYEQLEFLEKQQRKFKIFLFKFLEKITYKNANQIILATQEDKNFVVNRFSIKKNKIFIIPNFINTNIFKKLNIKKIKNRIIFIGRFKEQKNLFNLLKAIKDLKVKLLMIGNGPLKSDLKKYVDDNNLNVEFKENIKNSEIPIELNKSEIFILPSLYEGCPKTLLEAMSSQTACIGTNVEGINNIIRNRENGLLANTDKDSIKKAIILLLGDPGLRAKIGFNAREFIIENYSLEKVIEKEISIY